jgi:hypothetical protein
VREPEVIGESRAQHPWLGTPPAMTLGPLDRHKHLGVRHRPKRTEVSPQTITQPGRRLLAGLPFASFGIPCLGHGRASLSAPARQAVEHDKQP